MGNTRRRELNKGIRIATWAAAILGWSVIAIIVLAILFSAVLERTGFVDKLQSMEVEGREFGQSKSQASCVSEAIHRVANCESLWCESRVSQVFLLGCLDVATRDSSICANVREHTKSEAPATWAQRFCDEHDVEFVDCYSVFLGLVGHCRDASSHPPTVP